MKKTELLAPAGSYDVAIAAINAGADAVYLGGEIFGARAGASNLTQEEIIDVIVYAHINNRKIYLTVNTLLKNKEIEKDLFDFLCPLYEAGLDAVIVQDIGVIRMARECFPDMHIHASTQMTIMGHRTAEELARLGVSRVVVPRELSLEEIKRIKQTGLEVEAFVHGALCYCYSGQCYLSSFIGGRSGNRGRCAQPCRLPYDVIYNNNVINPGDQKYVLSPKDICTVDILQSIANAGVDSLKIEGRMKKKEYVSGVVEVYRKYIDNNYEDVAGEDYNNLLDLFNRNGFSKSYYNVHNSAQMISLKAPGFRTENRELINRLSKQYSDKILKHAINITVECKANKPLRIVLDDANYNCEYCGETPQMAQNQPLSEATLEKQLRKTNNTDFVIKNIKYDLDDNLYLNIKDINNARRGFIEKLYETILNNNRSHNDADSFLDTVKNAESNNESQSIINALISTPTQLDAVLSNDTLINRVYIDLNNYSVENVEEALERLQEANIDVFIALPQVARKADLVKVQNNYIKFINKSNGVLLRNIEQYFFLKEIYSEEEFSKLQFVFDYNINIINKYSADYYKNYGEITANVELNSRELLDVSYDEMIVYGKLGVMTSANCGLKTMNHCSKSNESYYLSDRLNNKFLVKCNCNHCFNIMYNCNALSLFKFAGEISQLGCKYVRLNFTDENSKQTRDIIARAESAFVDKNKTSDPDNTTRGHFKRGVL